MLINRLENKNNTVLFFNEKQLTLFSMSFLRDLIRWFLTGQSPEEGEMAPENSTPVALEIVAEKPVKTPSAEFDIAREGNPKVFLDDLRSIKSLANQFEQAREDLVKELQRLAPSRKTKNSHKHIA